jgi:hypothetical protein
LERTAQRGLDAARDGAATSVQEVGLQLAPGQDLLTVVNIGTHYQQLVQQPVTQQTNNTIITTITHTYIIFFLLLLRHPS